MDLKETVTYVPTEPIAPGETLTEVLGTRGMTQLEFAARLGRPLKTINGIVKGKVSITPETALQFEQVLGIPAYIWNGLESQYQETKLRIESRKQYSALVPQSKIYPYAEMAKWGWVVQTKDSLKKVENLLKYFAVTNFDNIVEEVKLQGAFRISTKHQHSLPAIVAWIRKGAIDAEQITTEPFDEKKLKAFLPQLRAMTLEDNPSELMPRLTAEFSKFGIALVVTPSLKNAPISASTRWVSPEKAIIQMSIRWSWTDIFWFSLFHEVGHILLDNKKDFNVDLQKNRIDGDKEKKIDAFAADTLIPPEEYKKLIKKLDERGSYAGIYDFIKSFAKHVGVHPGIVVGRLQHEGKMPQFMNGTRVRFHWKTETT